MTRRTTALCSVVAAAMSVATFGAAPASADCLGVFAATPHLEVKPNGDRVVQGYGGGYGCDSNAAANVCLVYNGLTRDATCRTYHGPPRGLTGEAPCWYGVWQTMVVVVPGTGAAKTTHSLPLVVTPFHCPVYISGN